ncbi:hypothetical protein SC09_contig10orf00002 [Bacillus subtilis]|uniref:Uncharacterized protein n=1 Tax=Bacillus subtilis TaxID=1423 RepID=A0A0D1JBS9_BACIU|nr:hypothetical protein SC09_contig10orf00002 [Bacillus subtilis]
MWIDVNAKRLLAVCAAAGVNAPRMGSQTLFVPAVVCKNNKKVKSD